MWPKTTKFRRWRDLGKIRFLNCVWVDLAGIEKKETSSNFKRQKFLSDRPSALKKRKILNVFAKNVCWNAQPLVLKILIFRINYSLFLKVKFSTAILNYLNSKRQFPNPISNDRRFFFQTSNSNPQTPFFLTRMTGALFDSNLVNSGGRVSAPLQFFSIFEVWPKHYFQIIFGIRLSELTLSFCF